MPNYYADSDAKGNIIGFYADDIWDVENIPLSATPITEELWSDAIANQGKYVMQQGAMLEVTDEQKKTWASIQHLYPDVVRMVDYVVDSTGAIIEWSLKDANGADVPQPTTAELQAAWESMQPSAASLLAAAQAKKKAEVAAAVEAKIVSGYISATPLAVDGLCHPYGTTLADQSNLGFEYSKMMANPTQTTVPYRTQDALDFVNHTRDEFKYIAEEIYTRTKYFMSQGYAYYRQIYAPNATVESVDAIVVTITDPPAS